MLDYQLIARFSPTFLQGLEMTLLVGVVSMAGALVFSILLLKPRMHPQHWSYRPVTFYVELVRNSPLIVQLYLLYYGLPVIGILLPAFWCGVIAIVGQHGAFLSEILRGGIEAVKRGQWEAGRALGLTEAKLFRLLILPQALRKVIPSVTNQAIILVKDTSLVSAIGIMELTLMAKLSIERSAATVEVFIVVAAFYLLLTTIVGLAGRTIERYLKART